MTTSEVEVLKASAANVNVIPKEIKMELGRRIVADFHSQTEAQAASDEFNRIFVINKRLPIFQSSKDLWEQSTCEVIANEGLAPSVSEAQRLVKQGSVRLNNERVSDLKLDVGNKRRRRILIQVGKLKFLRVLFK